MIMPIMYGYHTSSYEFTHQYCYESHQMLRTIKINFQATKFKRMKFYVTHYCKFHGFWHIFT